MNTWDKCKNCGGERGLHHFENDQCPVGGREAPIGQRQEWKRTTFEIDADELTALRKENAELVNALELSLELINRAAMRGQTPGCWSFAERDEARKMGEVAISKHKG